MKICNYFSRSILLFAILAVCLSNLGSTEAKRFSPISFLSKLRLKKDDLNNNIHDIDASSLPLRPRLGKNNLSIQIQSGWQWHSTPDNVVPAGVSEVPPSLEVTFSYWFDVIGGVLVAAFVYFWIKSILASQGIPSSYPFFDKSVLDNGFCNKKFPASTNEFLTQKYCGIADLVVVGMSYLLAKSNGKEKEPTFIAFAIYTLVHGAIHYSMYKSPASSGPVDALSLAILGVIMAFVPVVLHSVLSLAPKTKDTGFALPVSIIVWVGCVALYGLVFKQKQYALTYINAAIFLFFFGFRALLIGKSDPADIEARENLNNQFPNFWLGQVAQIMVIFIMCSEPFFCNGWFGESGGHLLFDLALYFYLMCSVF